MSLWNKTDPILDDDGGVIRGGMFPHQRKWWESKAYIKALITGYGGGKTLISAKRATALALHNAPSPYLYVSPSYKLAKRTIIPHLKTLLNGKGIKHTFNKSDFEFRIYHKGREGLIWIGSGDDPDALKGPNIGAANIDEPFIQSREVFDQVLARVRDPIARHREITLTGTPEELNWGYEICEGDEAGNFDIEVIHASSADNKTLPRQYIDSLLKGYDAETVEAYVNGLFVLRGKGVIYRDYNDDNLTDRVFKPGPIIWTHDFNFLPMSSAIIQRDGDKCYVVDEIVIDHADARDSALEFVDRYKDYRQCPVILYGDPSGRVGEKHGKVSNYIEIEAILREHGFKVTRKVQLSTLSIRDGQNSLKAKIRNSLGERTFFVNKELAPVCHKALTTVKVKAGVNGKPGSAFLEDETNNAQHIGTALRYFAHTEFPSQGRATVRIS
jgi:hypothetical protein